MSNQYRSVLASGGASTGGDALPAEVLSGKTFTNDNGAQTGTMTNNGAVTQTLTAGQSYTIPEGYHNGEGVVNGASLTATNKLSNSSTTSFAVEAGKIYTVVVSAGNTTATFSGADNTVIANGSDFAYEEAQAGYVKFYIIKANATGTVTTTVSNFIAQTVYEIG